MTVGKTISLSGGVLGALALASPLGGCAATAPNAVKDGFPAVTLYHGALPLCRPNEDIGPCTTDPLGQLSSEEAFPDGGFRRTVREIRRQQRDN